MNNKDVVYADKLLINKSDNIDSITHKLKNYYGDQYLDIGLCVKEHPIYLYKPLIDKKIKQLMLLNKHIEFKKEYIDKVFRDEIYYTLYIEKESSSRKAINKIINNTTDDETNKATLENNLASAYKYIVSTKPIINKQNLKTVYSILTTNIDMKNNQLDGDYYRLAEVSISKYHGIEPQFIETHMNQLFNFINKDDSENHIYKCLIIHFYFELIHPYYDFNGRMGRLLVFWYSYLNRNSIDMLFFSTAIGHYREQYLRAFNETQKLLKIDLTYAMSKILDILIANKTNYNFLQIINKYSLDQYKKTLSPLAKDMIMCVLAINDLAGVQKDNWIDKSTIDKHYQEYQDSTIYNEINTLKNRSIVEVSNTRPLKIKFLFEKFKNISK